MKLNFFLLVIFITVILAGTYFLNRPTAPNIKNVPVSTETTYEQKEPLTDFSFTDINNKEHELSDFEGKTIVLNFWASWCAPCVAEFPQLLSMAEQEQDDLVFLAISVDSAKENITKFFNRLDGAAQQNIQLDNVIIGWDPEKKISQDIFQTIRYPETYIIGPDRILRRKIIGADVDFASEAFRKSLY